MVAEPSREASGEAAPSPKNYSIPAYPASYAGYTHPLTFFTQGQIYLRYIFRTPMSKDGTYYGSLTSKTKHCSRITTMCCAKNRRCEWSRNITSRYYLSNSTPSTYRFDLKPLAIEPEVWCHDVVSGGHFEIDWNNNIHAMDLQISSFFQQC